MSRVLVLDGWAAAPGTWERTAFPRDGVLSYLEQLDGLPERLIEASSDGVVLVGFSMGGNSAMRLFLSHAEKVRGLVFVSTTPCMMEEKSVGWCGLSPRRLAALRLGTQMAFRENPSPLYAPANLDLGLAYLERTDLRQALRALPEVVRLSVPVAVFQSERDGIVRPHNAAFLKEVFPQAKVTMVPGSEHVLPAVIPELIDAAVREILAAPGRP